MSTKKRNELRKVYGDEDKGKQGRFWFYSESESCEKPLIDPLFRSVEFN
jgi:hypothetical protein